ncbi:MAG: hypothetical protein HRT65_06510 [Flavobacteriaceae bacterium]|nr:hypothetical protein [Flavobacteriaceae bacterium]
MKNKARYLLVLFVCTVSLGRAQSLLDEVEREIDDQTILTEATFKTTVLALGQSVQTRKQGTLEISANTRFWNIPQRTQGFLADRVSTRFGLSYAISDRLTLGVGATTFDGILDGHLKYKLIRQVSQGKGAPFSLTVFQNTSVRTNPNRSINRSDGFSDKLSFTTQALLARKFTRNLSLQVAPTFIHRNSSLSAEDPRNHFAIGFGGRYRIGGHVSISSEYYYLTNPVESVTTFDAFAIGVNWEMTDLMLQFHLSNAPNIAEDAFITQTRNNFNTRDGNLFFGFNATFVLHLRKNDR